MPHQSPLRAGDPRRVGRYRLSGQLTGIPSDDPIFTGTGPDGAAVTISMIRGDWAHDAAARDRFAAEAAVAKRVPPFCAARVLDAGVDGSDAYLVSEYVAGQSLLELDAGEAAVADAIRIRNTLDPLLIEDALWHASPADLAVLRDCLEPMAAAAASGDAAAFVHANWQLHAQIAAISPSQLLRALYSSLLETIERHTLAVLPAEGTPLPGYIQERYQLHADLVTALERRDGAETSRLIAMHNTQG